MKTKGNILVIVPLIMLLIMGISLFIASSSLKSPKTAFTTNSRAMFADPEPFSEPPPIIDPSGEPQQPEPSREPPVTDSPDPEPSAEPSSNPEPSAEPSSAPEPSSEPSTGPEPSSEPPIKPYIITKTGEKIPWSEPIKPYVITKTGEKVSWPVSFTPSTQIPGAGDCDVEKQMCLGNN